MIEGMLMWEGRSLAIFPDDKGRWRLDPIRGLDRLAGLRVRITGVRSQFDMLDLER